VIPEPPRAAGNDYRAFSGKLLAAAGPSGAAVLELWKRRSMSSRIDRGFPIQDEYAAVQYGNRRNNRGRERLVAGNQRCDETAASTCSKCQRLLDCVVANEGTDGTEGLDVMHRVGLEAVAAKQQRRCEDAPLLKPSP